MLTWNTLFLSDGWPNSVAETAYQSGLCQMQGPASLPFAGDAATASSYSTISATQAWKTCSMTEPVRRFVGLNLTEALPDETTILLPPSPGAAPTGQRTGDQRPLESQGLRLREGTIVDASIIEAPSSTKNRWGADAPKEREPVAFGMMDADTGIVRSMSTTAANAHDVTEAHNLLHGGETQVWAMPDTRGSTSGRRTWGGRWNGRWRCVPGKRRKLDPESAGH